MAKILYGVAGEGSGHSSRAKEIISYLNKKGHTVKIISYDKGYNNLSKYFKVEKIFGLHFDMKDNKVLILTTIYKNFLKTPQAAKSIKKVVKIIEDFEPNVVFSDFEPISCIAANIKKIPIISIDNQHRLTNTKIEYPRQYAKDAVLAKAVTNLMIFNTKACLVTSFVKTKIINKKTFIFPPILREEILKTKTKKGDYILVYLTSPWSGLTDVLKSLNQEFIVYGFNIDKVEKNLIFKKASQSGFLRDLSACKGVLANAGFTLITEALYLHKPYLAIPVKGQFEQILNAYYLDRLGYGKYYDELDKQKIELFLKNINKYARNLKKYKKDDNSKIFKKIDELVDQFSK